VKQKMMKKKNASEWAREEEEVPRFSLIFIVQFNFYASIHSKATE